MKAGTATNTAALPSQFAPNGNKGITLAWAFFTVTLVALIYTIAESRINIKKAQKEEEEHSKKLAELELNLKKMMGSQYTKIS